MDGFIDMKWIDVLIKIILILGLIFAKREVSCQQISLIECVNLAIENHPDVKEGYLQTGVVNAQIDQAKSNFLPEISASIFQSGNFGRSIDRFTNSYIDQFYNTTWAGVGVNMPVFTSVRNIHLLSASKSAFKAAEQAQESIKQATTQAVILAFINALALQENISNATKLLKNDSIQLSRLTIRKEAGLVTKTEEIQLLNQVKSDELMLLDATLNFDLAMMELSRVINKDLPTTLRLQPLQMDLTNESVIVPSISPTLPQFSEAKWRLQNIRDNIRATKALSFPTIRLSADYGTFYASSNPERTFVQQLNDTRNGSISLGLNIPIMRGLQNQPRIQEMKISEMIVQNDLERTTLQLTQELKIAISRYQNLKQRYQAANSLYTLANENMQLIQEQVNAGTALMVDFLLAQNNMERALNTLTQTKYQLIHQKMLVSFYTTGKFDLGK